MSRATANVAQMKREKDEVDKLIVLFTLVFFLLFAQVFASLWVRSSLVFVAGLFVLGLCVCFLFCLGIFRQKSTKVGFSRWRPSSSFLIETQKKQQTEN